MSFLGLINFYNKFVPNFADNCEPLYRLNRDDRNGQINVNQHLLE